MPPATGRRLEHAGLPAPVVQNGATGSHSLDLQPATNRRPSLTLVSRSQEAQGALLDIAFTVLGVSKPFSNRRNRNRSVELRSGLIIQSGA